jgi:hypothetical protein
MTQTEETITLGWQYKWKQVSSRRRTTWSQSFREMSLGKPSESGLCQRVKEIKPAVRFEETDEVVPAEDCPWVQMLIDELDGSLIEFT